METVVLRAFADNALGADDLVSYLFSIVATDDGVQFVYPNDDDTAFSFDQQWALDNAARLGMETPESIDDWLAASIHRINRVSFFDGPDTFDSVEAAVAAEKEFAEEAKEFKEDEKLALEEGELELDIIDEEETD
jgi:hypothetical protein